jgi:putative transcriptional regulator
MLNHLRELRRLASWSQSALAAKLEVSRQTIHAIEAGKYDPSLPLAFAIADLFKLKIEDIFKPGGAEVAPAPARPPNRDFID